MTQQNQQNPGQQVLWILLRGCQANLSKIQPGTAALKYWLGCRQPEAGGGGHDDWLIKAQDEALAADK